MRVITAPLGGSGRDRGSAVLELGAAVLPLMLFVYGTVAMLTMTRATYAASVASRDVLRLVTSSDRTVDDAVATGRARLITSAYGFTHGGTTIVTARVEHGTRATAAEVEVSIQVKLFGYPRSVTLSRTLSEHIGAHAARGAPP